MRRQHAVYASMLLLTAAVTWLWAHEGHQALPTRGVSLDRDKGIVILSPSARAALGPQTAEATLQPIEEHLHVQALLVTPWTQHAFATTRLGGRIAKVHVKPGERVEAGQTLAEVQSLELENLQLDWLTAMNDVELSSETLRQLESAGQRGAVSEQHVLEARSKRTEDRNALEIARRKLVHLGITVQELERLRVLSGAPPARTLPIQSLIAGTVTHADVVIGQVVEPTEHLFEISDVPSLWVRLDVLEKDLYRVQPGQTSELRLAAFPEKADVWQGRVATLGSALDAHTQLGAAWASLPNADGRLRPGQFGQARIRSRSSAPTLTVPVAAVLNQGAERFVFVEEGPGQYARQSVVVGPRVGDRAAVLYGKLVPGDRVVTAGAHELASYFTPGVLRLTPEASQGIGLRVELVARRPVARVVKLNGIVDLLPDRRALASARATGKVSRILVERDQAVQAGDILAEVASLEVHNWQLELLSSHLKLKLLEDTLRRLEPLAKSDGALSSRQWRETQSASRAVAQRRDSLQRRLRVVGLSAEQVAGVMERGEFVAGLPVRAPISGVIVRFSSALGRAVKAEDALFEIHDTSGALIRGHVFERQLPDVRIGQTARVRLAADPEFLADATVVRSGQVFGVEDRTLAVWAELRSPPVRPLWHGLLAELTLVVEEGLPVLAVPISAIGRESGTTIVFVQRPDGVFERRAVHTGRSDDCQVEVMSGLQLGDVVAVQGVEGLQTALASLR